MQVLLLITDDNKYDIIFFLKKYFVGTYKISLIKMCRKMINMHKLFKIVNIFPNDNLPVLIKPFAILCIHQSYLRVELWMRGSESKMKTFLSL